MTLALSIIIVALASAAHFISDNISLFAPLSDLLSSKDLVARYYWVLGLSTLILGWVFVGVTATSRNHLKHRLKSIDHAARHFRDLAEVYYGTDTFLFERLFCELVDGESDPVGPLESAVEVIKNDIFDTIGYAVSIFESYTSEVDPIGWTETGVT